MTPPFRTGRPSRKRALVTAAGAGIGRAVALRLARAGMVVLATDVDFGALQTLARCQNIRIAALDVTDGSAVDQTIEAAGPFQVLVNVAGYVHAGTILDCSDDVWNRSFDINVKSMHRTIRAVLPSMLETGAGSIVNVASVASSLMAVPDRYVYGATKGAVIGLTKAIAADFSSRGIRCNAVCPGTIDTPSLRRRLAELPDPAAAETAFRERQLVARLGHPEEVAHLIAYLASDEASFTTGAVHIIDGGWSA